MYDSGSEAVGVFGGDALLSLYFTLCSAGLFVFVSSLILTFIHEGLRENSFPKNFCGIDSYLVNAFEGIPYSELDYYQLVDSKGRIQREGKRGYIDDSGSAEILEGLGIRMLLLSR